MMTSAENSILIEFREDDIWGKGNSVLDIYLASLALPIERQFGIVKWATTEERLHAQKVLGHLKEFSFHMDDYPGGLS